MLNFNYSLRRPLVPTPKKHLLLIKNKLLPFKKQLIFCLIMAAVYGSQLKHTHMLLKAANPVLYNSVLEQRFYNMSAVASSFYSMSRCWFVCEMHSTLKQQAFPPVSLTGWSDRQRHQFFPVFFPSLLLKSILLSLLTISEHRHLYLWQIDKPAPPQNQDKTVIYLLKCGTFLVQLNTMQLKGVMWFVSPLGGRWINVS